MVIAFGVGGQNQFAHFRFGHYVRDRVPGPLMGIRKMNMIWREKRGAVDDGNVIWGLYSTRSILKGFHNRNNDPVKCFMSFDSILCQQRKQCHVK